MSKSSFLASLSLGTLVIVFLIGLTGLIYFLRKRSNRKPMEHEPNQNVGERIDRENELQDKL